MVSFAAEPIFSLGFFKVTNSLLDTFLVDGLLIGLIVAINKKISLIPGMLQNVIEWVIEAFYEITESVAEERASRIFPYLMSFFLFILLANWSGLIPGISAIGLKEGHTIVPFFRPATSDLNTTLGLALISLVATHVMSIRVTGIKDYLGRYISLNPLNLYIGVLEAVGEIVKVVSLSFRLFGNIFAGEIVLGTVSTIFAVLFPIPFLMLEVIVGLVQALVFAMLTMAFMAVLTTPHHHEEAKEVIRK
ncbi:MAG TPA: F0F1 ATP synthase subunit A [Patescibacteria group bacterium]|jgi:F-type H+-transporting ATPase subunit a|nr:F0F1 ATP synthase subunit A [Patescibacteria group bacterium]